MKTAIQVGVLLLASCAFASASRAAGTRAELDGVWLFYGSKIPDDPGLTPSGRSAARAAHRHS